MELCPKCGTEIRYNAELSYDLGENYYYCKKCNMNYKIPIRCLKEKDDL